MTAVRSLFAGKVRNRHTICHELRLLFGCLLELIVSLALGVSLRPFVRSRAFGVSRV